MQVEQIDREAAEEWRMDLDPGMRSVLAVSFARHRIAERERVVGEIVAWLRRDEDPYPDSYDIADEIEAKFGGRDET